MQGQKLDFLKQANAWRIHCSSVLIGGHLLVVLVLPSQGWLRQPPSFLSLEGLRQRIANSMIDPHTTNTTDQTHNPCGLLACVHRRARLAQPRRKLGAEELLQELSHLSLEGLR